MQTTQHAPLNQGRSTLLDQSSRTAANVGLAKAPIEVKRVARDDRGLRCGPQPGEIYAEEAKFGSFS